MFELGLRLVGYGYPAGFFREGTRDGHPVLIENRQFGWRFFPPHLARTPQPLVLPASKPAGTARIFFFGESAAMGDPDPDFGPPRALQTLLREEFPKTPIEVVNVAMTAINSHAVLEIARDCAAHQGDVWVVYMGNNEVIGPFGAGTIFGVPAPPWAIVRLTLAVSRSRVGQFLTALSRGVARGESMPQTWGGLKMFLDHQVRSDDPRMTRIRAHYRRNLEGIIRLGVASGAKVVVCTVASNLKECAPFGSQHRPDLSSLQLSSWEDSYQQGVALEKARRFEEAEASYRRAAEVDDSFAALQFRWGRCLLALGKPVEARRAFERARDEDTLRFRSDRRNNEIVRAVATGQEQAGVYLVDVEEQLAVRSSGGVPGLEFFWEHVHFNASGTYALAESVARRVAEALPEPLRRSRSSGLHLSERECARRLTYSRWNEQKILREIHRRHQGPPCTLQMDHEEREAWWRSKLMEGHRSGEPAALLATVASVRAAVVAEPQDWVLNKNLGQMLEAAGDLAGARSAWERVASMVPQYGNAWYHLGNVLDQQGQSAEAEARFRQALAIDPHMAEARSGLGLALAAQGRFEEAFQQYAQAIAVNPDSIHAYINWGMGLAAQGQYAEATRKYGEALKINPEDAIAHHNLGLALAASGRSEEAMARFARALGAQPDFLPARLSLSRELLRSRQAERAIPVLEAGLTLGVGAPDLHLQLGLAFELLGRTSEAARELQEALRLNPGLDEARQVLHRLSPTR